MLGEDTQPVRTARRALVAVGYRGAAVPTARGVLLRRELTQYLVEDVDARQ